MKPPAAARGIGIRVINKMSQIPKRRKVLIQDYISNPYLIDGVKFDLRVYVYVTSFDPLRVYICEDGLARFATVKYSNKASTISETISNQTTSNKQPTQNKPI